jgi:hypothetical protein
MAGRDSKRQALVDEVFRQCLAKDRRSLDEIRQAIRERLAQVPRVGSTEAAFRNPNYALATWQPPDHELQIMISRNCMGDGEWDFHPAYSTPPRYVSKARVEELVGRAEQGSATASEMRALSEMLADVEVGVKHWQAKHARARAKETELTNLARTISNRAFQGHTGALL